MAGPLFILAGGNNGGCEPFKADPGLLPLRYSWTKGGLGMVSVMANMIFAGISGSGAATMSAIGSLTVPELKKSGYHRSFVASLIAGSGALGPIIPPSTNMIVYASLTGFSTGKLFIGGIVPGIIIGLCLMECVTGMPINTRLILVPVRSTFGLSGKPSKKPFSPYHAFYHYRGRHFGLFYRYRVRNNSLPVRFGLRIFHLPYSSVERLYTIFKRATASSAMLMMLMGMANIYSYILPVKILPDT